MKFKRGAIGSVPSLAAGEPAFTTDRFGLFVGSAGGNRRLAVLENPTATAAPGVNDDAGDGYSRGSRWVDTTTDKVYLCADDTVGAAVWTEVGAGAGFALLAAANTFTENQHVRETSADTSNAIEVLSLARRTSGAAADGIGGSVLLKTDTTTAQDKDAARIMWNFATAADASRKGQLSFGVYDASTLRTGITLGTDGTNALLGFHGLFPPVSRRTGDVATGLAANGLFDASGSYDATKLTGTVAAARLPDFVGAGGSAARGAVPSPGGTAHTNVPYVLRDNGAWALPRGWILGRAENAALENLGTIGAVVDLPTVQSFSITLDVATDVTFEACCDVSSTTTAAITAVYVDIAGTDVQLAIQTTDTANGQYPLGGFKTVPLAAGTYTVKIQFYANAGVTAFWNRAIRAFVG